MARPTFIRCSISWDTATRDRAKVLATEMASSVSALTRQLVRDAYERHQWRALRFDGSQSAQN